MKKVALLCVAALCLAACHCERRTTGTPCRKAACQCAGAQHKACKCHAGKHHKDCKCPHCKKAHKPGKPAMKKAPAAPAKTVDQKAAEQTAALSKLGNVKRQGNVLAVSYKEPIRFAHNSDQIDPASFTEIDTTAILLKQYPNNTVVVEGYTDSLGNADYNVDLSQRRAQAVANALVKRGVKAENVSAVGYGAANPVATNSTAAGRAQNRRVELKVNVK